MSNSVSPIRNKKEIEASKNILSPRDRLLFIMGINSALRISDLLSLTVGNVRKNGKIKSEISVREHKTGKEKRFPFNDSIKNELKNFLRPEWGDEIPLFKSRKGVGAIQRDHAHEILSTAAREIGLDNIGTHSMRKTFGYHVYQQSSGNLGLVQKLLNHSNSCETLRYIGIEQDELNEAYLKLNL